MFTIKLTPSPISDVAEEGFLSNLKEKFKKKSSKNKTERSSFGSLNEAIDQFNESPISRYQFTLTSSNYGNDCIWDFSVDKVAAIDDTLRSALNRAYQNANAALPKIREIAAVQFYDKVEYMDTDEQLITEEQAKKYSRESFKQGIAIDYVSLDITKANKILVEFDLTSKIVKNEDVNMSIEDVSDGIVRSSDEIRTFY